MTKKLLYIATLLLAAVAFASCSDDPARPPMTYPEQEGNGTGASPYNVGAALVQIYSEQYTNREVYVKGIISKIDESAFDPAYGNITYYISDDGRTENELEVYRCLNMGGTKFSAVTDLSVGDEVIIICRLTLYNNSVAETQQGAVIVSINGSEYDYAEPVDPAGSGTVEDPFNVTATLNWLFESNITTAADSKEVYVKGIVSKIESIEPSFGNATYYISDSGTNYEELEIYRGYSLGGKKFSSTDEIKVGDEVIIYGKPYLYNGSVPEFNTGSQIYSLNGTTSAVAPDQPSGPTADPKGTGTATDPYNCAMANKICADGTYTDAEVYVEGTICNIKEVDTGSFGNATYFISDDGTTNGQFEIYRGYYLNGDKFTSADQIKVGDKVVVCGKLTNYNGTYEMTTGSKIVSINGQGGTTGGGEEPGVPTGEAKGTGTADDPYNCAMANKICADGSYTDAQVYVEGTICNIKEIDTGSYGNATYFISDDGTTNGQFEIYRCYYLNGDKFTSADQIKVGDKVVVCGKLTNYNGTYEMTTGSKIVSINGQGGTTGGGEEPTPGDNPIDPALGSGTEADPYVVAAIIALNPTSTQEAVATGVWVEGYIVGTIPTGGSSTVISGTVFGTDDAAVSNLVIAPTADTDDYTKCIPVQLPSGSEVRTALNLKDNPGNLGKHVLLKGDVMKYCGAPGLKNTKEYKIVE